MFEDRSVGIMAYNLETILAEKFETVITRGLTNTRMRDFYDIHILTSTQVVDGKVFAFALKKTMEKRGTAEQMNAARNVIRTISENAAMNKLWQRYRKKYNYAADVTWEMAVDALVNLCDFL